MTPKQGLDIVGAIQILANVTKEEWGQVAMRFCSGDPIRIAFLKAAVHWNNEYTKAAPEERTRLLAITEADMAAPPATAANDKADAVVLAMRPRGHGHKNHLDGGAEDGIDTEDGSIH